MEVLNISLFASFTAGIITFISPCILPLLPSFISLISGISVKDLQNSSSNLKTTLFKTLIFVLGFSCIFIILGMSASAAGRIFSAHRDLIRYFSASVIIILGAYIAGFFNFPFLYRQFSVLDKVSNKTSIIGIFITGCAFALGWTPCVGAILAPILFIVSIEGNALWGFKLLLFYSMGLAIPFLVSALSINYFLRAAKIVSKRFRIIEIVSGSILIITGFLLLTDSFIKFQSIVLGFF